MAHRNRLTGSDKNRQQRLPWSQIPKKIFFLEIALGVSSRGIREIYQVKRAFFFGGGFFDGATDYTDQAILTRSVPEDAVCSKEVPFGYQKD
mgnify:CR=1 FL=1